MSAFYVDLNQPHLSRRDLDKLGAHASPTGELTFDNFLIPEDNLIGNKATALKFVCVT